MCQLEQPAGDHDIPDEQKQDGKDRKEDAYCWHIQAKVEHARCNTHIGSCLAEDIAPKHDERDDQSGE